MRIRYVTDQHAIVEYKVDNAFVNTVNGRFNGWRMKLPVS